MTQRITLDLTHRQYELLLQMVYMADYCYAVVPRPETMTPEQGEIEHFLKARESVLHLLNVKAKELEGAQKLTAKHVSVFTFNDTVLISLRAEKGELQDSELRSFMYILRKFVFDSQPSHRMAGLGGTIGAD